MAARRSASRKAKDGKPTGSVKQRAARNTKARRRAKPKATTKAAQKATAAAEKAGAKGRRLTAQKQAACNAMVMALAAQGMTQTYIADKAGISTRQVERIVAETRRMPSGLDLSPTELLEELARGFRMAIANFEIVAAENVDADPTVAIRGWRASNETRRAYAELMSHVGKLPTDLELFRSEMQLQQIGDQMVETMQRLKAGDIDVDAALDFFRQLALSPRELVVEGTVTEELPSG